MITTTTSIIPPDKVTTSSSVPFIPPFSSEDEPLTSGDLPFPPDYPPATSTEQPSRNGAATTSVGQSSTPYTPGDPPSTPGDSPSNGATATIPSFGSSMAATFKTRAHVTSRVYPHSSHSINIYEGKANHESINGLFFTLLCAVYLL